MTGTRHVVAQGPVFLLGFLLGLLSPLLPAVAYPLHLAFVIGSLSAASPYFCPVGVSKQGIETERRGRGKP